MKKWSVTMKLTLWYAFFMLLSIVLTWYVFERSADVAAERYYRDELLEACALAIESCTYEDGYLEFEPLPSAMENVHVSYFTLEGDLLYGHICAPVPLEDGKFSKAYDDYERHRYILDQAFEAAGYGRIFVRASISMEDAERITDRLSGAVLFIIPLIFVLSLAGGFLLSRRAMYPVKKIAETTEDIAYGEDLKKRIPVAGAQDELHRLSYVINRMLSRLEDAFEQEKRFTGDVSHELRTPVSAILSMSEAALMDGADEKEKSEALSKIRDKALGMKKMISNLLLLARMDAGKADLTMEKMDISEIAQAMADDVCDRYSEKDVAFNANLVSAVCTCDAMMIAQVISILLENAYRYTPEGGRIEVMTFSAAEGAILVVENRGAGFTKDVAEHIFDRFYRADRARSEGGNGLGLSIAKAIAKLHGASLTCESEKDTFVRFTLILK